MNKQKELWAFWANKHGPWWKTPQKVTFSFPYYFHKNGDAFIEKPGIIAEDHYIAFADKDKKEVQKFINGFMACRKLLSSFYRDK